MTRLEILRRSRGLSQKMVAADLGISATILSHVETRRRECYPRLRKALAELYGVDETVLFDDMGMAREVDPEALRRAAV